MREARGYNTAINPIWTEGAVTRLRALYAEGFSFGQIAKVLAEEQLGAFTRSAVIGKAGRLGLHREGSIRRTLAAPSRAIAHRPKRKTGVPALARAPKPAPPPAPELLPPLRDEAGRLRSVVTLRAGECKWPIGDPGERDFGFCARPVDGQPVELGGDSCYCAAHARAALRSAA